MKEKEFDLILSMHQWGGCIDALIRRVMNYRDDEVAGMQFIYCLSSKVNWKLEHGTIICDWARFEDPEQNITVEFKS